MVTRRAAAANAEDDSTSRRPLSAAVHESSSSFKSYSTVVSPFIHMTFAVALCAFHVRASSDSDVKNSTTTTSSNDEVSDFLTRFTSGSLSNLDLVLLVSLGILAMEIMSWLSLNAAAWIQFNPIPVRGKHLDEFTMTDKIFIAISKAQTGPFVYFMLRYALAEPNLLWMPNELSLGTVLLPLPILFLVFDFFYTSLHWALHIKAIYGYIHKHHHTQKAPSRATQDAINVHPIEYVLGEYNHLWATYLCCRMFGMRIHVLGIFLFLAVGGILAGWNHTRYDIVASLWGYTLYDSKAHDVHHRIPQSNYGQYTMFWDHVFGTFRAYDPNDRVNPKAQLDPKTGKSLEYMASHPKND